MSCEYAFIYSFVLGIIIYIYLYLENINNKTSKLPSIRIPLLTSIIFFIILLFFMYDYEIKNSNSSNTQEILMEDFY
jgi:hypothetical protein